MLNTQLSILGTEADASMTHLKTLDLKPLGNKKADLIRELLRLARTVLLREQNARVPYENRSCFLHPDIQPRVREIGEELWEMCKDTDPGVFDWFFQCDLLTIPRCFHREIEYVWDGIGPVLNMSYMSIYVFGPDGEPSQRFDFKNAYGGAMAIWGALGRKYLTADERDPHNMRSIRPEHDSPLEYADKVWKLENDRLLPCEQVVLQSTLDNAVVRVEDLPTVVEAFEEFDRIHGPWFETNNQVFSIGRQGKLLRTLLDRDDVRAVGWRQTSVIDVPWDGRTDPETDEEIPYNLDTMDTHWFIEMAGQEAA